MELQGFYIGSYKIRPRGRTQTSLILTNSKIYMYGGLSSTGLEDLWKFDLKGFYNLK